jgi:hypothetical protein
MLILQTYILSCGAFGKPEMTLFLAKKNQNPAHVSFQSRFAGK